MAVTYQDRANIYWKQANELLQKEEWTKASELAWGSVVEAVNALAEFQGRKLTSHGQTKNYIRGIAQSLQDERINELFKKAETFHANFYHEFLDETDVKEILPYIQEFLEKIGTLLPPQKIGG